MRRLFVWIVLGSLGFAVGCGGGSKQNSRSSNPGPATPPSTPSNVLPIAVDGGPTASQTGGAIYVNGAFASATICTPGSTSNCVTVDHLLVDTGSSGLRVLQTAIPSLKLPAVNTSNGSPAYDCVSFVDRAFLWGPVQEADVTLAGETARDLPIQVISSTSSGVPASCSNGSTQNQNTQASLGANGILGIGLEPTDCFFAGTSTCDRSSGLASPPTPAYYTCSGSACAPAFISKANQVANPAVFFSTDNNGVIIKLGSVSGSAASVTGSLIFGIGTESNNQLASTATVLTLTCDNFSTTFENHTLGITDATTCAGPGSFIDSGSNALFFPNLANITTCPAKSSVGDISSFYCPSSLQNFAATNKGANDATKAANFSVDNAENLFTNTSTSSDAALGTLAGTNPTGVGFDWGLPFFYGNQVYMAIDGQNVPAKEPAAPWWAY